MSCFCSKSSFPRCECRVRFPQKPFFAANDGLDLSVLNPATPSNREGMLIATFLVLVTILGKVVAGFTVFGQTQINRLAIGVGMIPRGEVVLVFAAVGSANGVLSKPLEAAIIAMVILTTFLAPLLLRFVFPHPGAMAVKSK